MTYTPASATTVTRVVTAPTLLAAPTLLTTPTLLVAPTLPTALALFVALIFGPLACVVGDANRADPLDEDCSCPRPAHCDGDTMVITRGDCCVPGVRRDCEFGCAETGDTAFCQVQCGGRTCPVPAGLRFFRDLGPCCTATDECGVRTEQVLQCGVFESDAG